MEKHKDIVNINESEKCETHFEEKNEYLIDKQESNENCNILIELKNKDMCEKISDNDSGKLIENIISENKENNYLENSCHSHIDILPESKNEFTSSKFTEPFKTDINNLFLENNYCNHCETNNSKGNNFCDSKNANMDDMGYNNTRFDNDLEKKKYGIDKCCLLNIDASLENGDKDKGSNDEMNKTDFHIEESITTIDIKSDDLVEEAIGTLPICFEETVPDKKSMEFNIKNVGKNMEKSETESLSKNVGKSETESLPKNAEKANNTSSSANNYVIEIEDSSEGQNDTYWAIGP